MDTAVGLVKAYLELCGYFVLAELPVRAAEGGAYRDVTDLDIVAVRFPHPPLALPRRVARPLDVFLGADPAFKTFEAGVDVIVGEVKEGHARLNPALRREETVAFALRRLGCCPEAEVSAQARAIARAGMHEMTMPGQVGCRLRLVTFAGYGYAPERGVLTVSLSHCVQFIRERLREARDVLTGTQFKDSVLGLFALQDKLARIAGSAGETKGESS
jgi:hypothetical protein